MVSAPRGLCLTVSVTVGTTEWLHLPRTVKKNVCHTSALLQGDGRGKRTRLLLCEYTDTGTELAAFSEKNKNKAASEVQLFIEDAAIFLIIFQVLL